MDAININNLYGGYENKIVLNSISLSFETNKMTAIVGPNGSGKSTLLKYLIKELKDKNKSITVLGKNITDYAEKELAKIQSMVPQMAKQDYDFTVKEVVALGRYCHDDIDKNNEVVEKTLELVQIKDIEDKLITNISGGELQLTMLARAICQQTEIILLDEPTNNLDPKHVLLLMGILTKLKLQNKTIICVIHDLNAVLRYFDNAVLLLKGKVYAEGPVERVITSENISKVYGIKAFISQANDQLPSTIYYNL